MFFMNRSRGHSILLTHSLTKVRVRRLTYSIYVVFDVCRFVSCQFLPEFYCRESFLQCLYDLFLKVGTGYGPFLHISVFMCYCMYPLLRRNLSHYVWIVWVFHHSRELW